MARYVALFNQRDWDGLRALLADDVKLNQFSHPLRVGPADAGLFFTVYAKCDGVWLAPAWARGPGGDRGLRRPRRSEAQLHDVARVARRQDQLIHDYRHVRYVVANAELALAPDVQRAGDGAAF